MHFLRTLSILTAEKFVCVRFASGSALSSRFHSCGSRLFFLLLLESFILVTELVYILSVFVLCLLLAVFAGNLQCLSLFLSAVFLIFSTFSQSFAGHLESFSLFLSAVSEVSRCFCWPSRKFLAVFVGRLGSFSLFLFVVSEVSCCFCWPSRKFLAVFVCRLGSFSLFLSAVSEVSRCYCRPSRKFLAVFVGHLGSFSLFL